MFIVWRIANQFYRNRAKAVEMIGGLIINTHQAA